MAEIHITRTGDWPDERTLEAARTFLFGALHGATKDDDRGWRRFWRRITRLEPGEMVRVEMVIPRNGRFHRKAFALVQLGFQVWESGRKHKTYKGRPVAPNFEQFREDITILAGFYEQTFDLRGRMKLRAKSWAYSSMDDVEFERLYNALADVLLQHVLTTYKGRAELDAVVDQILGFHG